MNHVWKGLPIVIFGTGATSKEAEQMIKRINLSSHSPVYDFIGFVSNDKNDECIISSDEEFLNLALKYAVLGAVLPFADGELKDRIYNQLISIKNIVFPNIIDPDAKLIKSGSICLGVGNVIECGATINMNSSIGSFNLININAIVGHDNKIGNFCTINPGAVLSGHVTLEDHVLIGAGAVVKQNINIGKHAVLGLGGFTVKDIQANQTLVCEYAHELKKGD